MSGPTVPEQLIDALRLELRGEVIDRAHPEYDAARRVWNGLIDRHPAVIARCADAADVQAAVRLASEHRPIDSIRGGGHQVAGSAVCDDGTVIDLSAMNAVHVDPDARVARVGPDESAFPHRGDRFNLSVDAASSDPALDDDAVRWARGMWDATEPHSSGGVYVNFAGLDDEQEETRPCIYRGQQRRVAEVRAKYDPTGLFEAAARRA
jgi:hypothetical protein